jgi:hypothetical protein
MRGPWARSVLTAVARDARPTAQVDSLRVEVGRVSAQVGGCDVTLSADPVARSSWAAMVRYARGMGPLEQAVAGRLQSTHLDHLLAEDWGEQLIPRPGQIRRECSCDGSGACEHVAAAGLAFADAIDEDAALLLRWRGCLEEPLPEADRGDPWAGGRLPEQGPPRALPVGAVLKRLGPSGILVGDDDLADVLLPAYEAFAGR